METSRCRAFVTAADSGSFTRAAEILGYSPSGVSQLVNALEGDLGFALLLRDKKGVRLTENGRLMLPAIRDVLNQEERMRQTAADINGISVGSVTIGAYSSIATHWLPEVIKEFKTEYPHINIMLMEGIRQEIDGWLEEKRIDVAFTTYKEPMEYEWIPLREDRMLAVLPPDHPRAGDSIYPLSACVDEKFIMPALGRDADVADMMERNNITPNIIYTTLEDFAALAMIEQGMGMSVMNELITLNWQCNVVKIPVYPPEKITMGIAMHSLKKSPPAVKKFVDCAVRMLTRSEG